MPDNRVMQSPELDPRVRGLPVLVLDDRRGGLRMVFRPMPVGAFRMGSRGYHENEQPQHEVRFVGVAGREDLPAFWLAETPVTQRQFAMWTKSKAYAAWCRSRGQKDRHQNQFKQRPDAPVESVTWFEARAYCGWLATRGWSQASQGVLHDLEIMFDVPAEAEWEYGCRAGSTTEYWSGDGTEALAGVGWHGANSPGGAHDVGALRANPWGLYDVHGNVWEWCVDAWDSLAYRRRLDGMVHSPAQTRRGTHLDRRQADRVVRGGSWGGSARGCRTAYRFSGWPGGRSVGYGFRVCLLPGPAVQLARHRGQTASAAEPYSSAVLRRSVLLHEARRGQLVAGIRDAIRALSIRAPGSAGSGGAERVSRESECV